MGSERFVVGLVGAGIGTSASPALHEAEADALGLRYAYQVLDLDDLGLAAEEIGELLEAARRMGFRGLNITHPCKQLVVDYLDELSPEAVAVGAVNTVVFSNGRTFGHNTDIFGFEQSFNLGLPNAARKRIVVLGAGGAGAAVAYVALALGGSELTVIDLDLDRSADLARRLALRFGPGSIRVDAIDKLPQRMAACDGLIHATPTGMRDYPGMPFSPDLLRRELWVADVVYRPLETELLRQASELGCRTLDGGGMAVFQAFASLSLFTGVAPDAARMMRHFDRTFRESGVADGVHAPVS
ncbi:MAG TPA: shikimate dehydrogenase [Gaiellaceae bacterium]